MSQILADWVAYIWIAAMIILMVLVLIDDWKSGRRDARRRNHAHRDKD